MKHAATLAAAMLVVVATANCDSPTEGVRELNDDPVQIPAPSLSVTVEHDRPDALSISVSLDADGSDAVFDVVYSIAGDDYVIDHGVMTAGVDPWRSWAVAGCAEPDGKTDRPIFYGFSLRYHHGGDTIDEVDGTAYCA